MVDWANDTPSPPGSFRNGFHRHFAPGTSRTGKETSLGIGFGIFLMAVGAILAWAVSFPNSVVDWHTVGLIVLVAGAAVTFLSFFFWDSWGGYTVIRRRPFYRERVIRDDIDPPAY